MASSVLRVLRVFGTSSSPPSAGYTSPLVAVLGRDTRTTCYLSCTFYWTSCTSVKETSETVTASQLQILKRHMFPKRRVTPTYTTGTYGRYITEEHVRFVIICPPIVGRSYKRSDAARVQVEPSVSTEIISSTEGKGHHHWTRTTLTKAGKQLVTPKICHCK